jgi:hypothetical protein
MIGAIIDLALRNRLLVLLLTGLTCLVGVLVYQQMPKDIYPDLNAPLVNVITSCEGMAAEDVERMITFPLESLMNGTPHVTRVRLGHRHLPGPADRGGQAGDRGGSASPGGLPAGHGTGLVADGGDL